MKIIIKGAREHNLKNIDLEIPRNKLVVFTGISGSGKSTLAFDTIFAEGQRRYLESLSSYARQFLGQMEKPDVDLIEGLSPAISIDQKSASRNPRSTVGTITEIQDYMRLLFAKIGVLHCPKCGKVIIKLTVDEIMDRILDIQSDVAVEILSPVIRKRKGEYSSFLKEMWESGFSFAYINGEKKDLNKHQKIALARYEQHDIDIIVDRVEIKEKNITRIYEAVETALKSSDGLVKIKSSEKEYTFNQNYSCPDHDIEFPELEPRLFSFNSPYGACPACEGLGLKKEIDASLLIPDKNKTISEGAILPWSYKKNNYVGSIINAAAKHYRINDSKRIKDFKKEEMNYILYGEENPPQISVSLVSKKGSYWKFNLEWRGVVGFLEGRYHKTDSDSVRTDIEKYMSQKPCVACKGSRYRKEALYTFLHGKNINDLSRGSVMETLKFFEETKFEKRELLIASRIIKEIKDRLGFLASVGLGYLSLARAGNTLAGGEMQRIRLASQIGSQLVGVLYILDEPSIGLHSRDNTKLLNTLKSLRDLGNSLIVIEHDEETMREADWLVDIGPGAGRLGGEIVASGKPKSVLENKKSLTAKYLSGKLKIEVPSARRLIKNKKFVTIKNASEHNLKNITVGFPLRAFSVITGVSGAGKSTLINEILYKGLASKIMKSLDRPGRHKEIIGLENINKVIMVDQSPIGRTPRSNPATYTGFFTPIRALFASTKDARARGYTPSRFSFNVSGGRCENCHGDGFLKIEMQFMPDVYLPCDVCKSARYNSETLQVKYKGKSISDVLKMTVREAAQFFSSYSEIYNKLKVLEEVGLSYIELGQNATTLSGGEAQRIKLASELSRRAAVNTLYILDEPTTGLHFDDIKKLLGILNLLVESGNTVIVIEHNLDVIKTADYIVDLGPEGGDGGGKIIVSGSPEEVASCEKSYTGRYLKSVLK